MVGTTTDYSNVGKYFDQAQLTVHVKMCTTCFAYNMTLYAVSTLYAFTLFIKAINIVYLSVCLCKRQTEFKANIFFSLNVTKSHPKQV